MKKITLFIALLVCAVGFSQQAATNVSALGENNPVYAQSQKTTAQPAVERISRTYSTPGSFTSEEVRGTNVNPGEAGTASNATRGADVIITHSNTQTIEAGAEIACANGVNFLDNSIYRDFDLTGDFGITGDFEVTDAEIAIGVGVITPGGFPLTVNIYSAPVGSFPDESQLTLQGTATTTVFDTDSETMLSIPVTATIPAGEAMVYEAMLIDDGTATNYMRFGANNDGQTGISWIKADGCGAPTPVDLNDFGLANSFVMNIVGDEATGGGGPCETVGPSNAFENGKSATFNLGRIVAHDVTVPADTDFSLETVSGNFFIGGTGSGVNAAFVDVYIYDDAGGTPGTALDYQAAVVPVSQTVMGTNFGFDIWEVVLDITDFNLVGQAGVPTTYWIGMSVEATDASNIFWENSTAGAIGEGEAYDDGAGGGFVIDTLLEGVYNFAGTCTPQGGGGGCVVTEDFEDSALPTGWSVVTNSGTCTDWFFGADLPTGPDFDTIGIYFDDDACGNGADPSNTTLLTDVYDNAGATFVTVEYDVAFQEVAGGETFLVEIFDGNVWQLAALYNADIDPIFTESLDATGFANADFQVRFTYDDAAQWGWHAGIDNFCLDYDTPAGAPNDECADAIALACGDTDSGDTTTGTDSGGNTAADLWYSFTGTGTPENVTVSLCSGATDYDSYLRVWSDCAGTTEIAFNDDSCGLQSELTFLSDGTSTYYIMVEGFGGNEGMFDIGISCIIGTEDNQIEGFSYYPNPATNVINLDAQSNIERVAIYNILGQKVIDQNIEATSTQLNVADLATGTYLMEVSVDGKSATYKVVKN